MAVPEESAKDVAASVRHDAEEDVLLQLQDAGVFSGLFPCVPIPITSSLSAPFPRLSAEVLFSDGLLNISKNVFVLF